MPDHENIGLDGFEATPSDDGISLDELSESFARLIGGGDDPYSETKVPEPGDLASEQTEDDLLLESDEPQQRADDTDCPVTPRSILEAILFVGHPHNDPLTSKQIAALMRGVRPTEIDELVVELNAVYEGESCPYLIESAGSGYRMALRPRFESLRENFYRRVKESSLSQPAIDVLAMVAYRQPISRQQIDTLRDKPSGAILNQMVRRELLRVERQSDKGRTLFYRTTPRFLELFGLRSLDELPRGPETELPEE